MSETKHENISFIFNLQYTYKCMHMIYSLENDQMEHTYLWKRVDGVVIAPKLSQIGHGADNLWLKFRF